jgi:hypothetical protein
MSVIDTGGVPHNPRKSPRGQTVLAIVLLGVLMAGAPLLAGSREAQTGPSVSGAGESADRSDLARPDGDL